MAYMGCDTWVRLHWKDTIAEHFRSRPYRNRFAQNTAHCLNFRWVAEYSNEQTGKVSTKQITLATVHKHIKHDLRIQPIGDKGGIEIVV